MKAWDAYTDIVCIGDPDFKNKMPHMKDLFAKKDDMTGPYAVYYLMYEAVARQLIEEDLASTDWESSKGPSTRVGSPAWCLVPGLCSSAEIRGRLRKM